MDLEPYVDFGEELFTSKLVLFRDHDFPEDRVGWEILRCEALQSADID